jgi:kinesin family protein 3/17
MGVIPLLCTELFEQIGSRSATKQFTVHCSLLEIYNENLNDLLAQSGESRDLQIFDDSAAGGRGIYVEGVSENLVDSTKSVLTLLSSGQAGRAVGKTNMNEHSSRSHMVLTLRISACDLDDEAGIARTISKLHLIDLAGSERQKATGATGDRLKEGAQINLSLSALGNVINALTEPKAAGSKGRHVPYRDSKLTRLLQDSLGGNAFTVMICNVSPAEMNAEETMSSLRFAERAKKVENVAVVNRDPKGARIAELLAENKALRAKCERLEAHAQRLESYY